MSNSFSIRESLRFGWNKTRQHNRILFAVLLVLFASRVAYAIVDKVLGHTLQGFAAGVVLTLVSFVLGIGFTLITLKIAKGESVSYSDFIPPFRTIGEFLCTSILTGLMIVGGLILLIVPGIYLALRFSMTRFAVLEGGGILGSLRASTTLTQGIKWHLLKFFVVFLAINVLGMALFFVGLLVTLPVTMIAYAHVYQKLQQRPVEA